MIGAADVLSAARRIAGHVRRTPLLPSPWLSRAAGRPVYLKPEFWQETGSFKVRGAGNLMLSLDAGALRRGVVAASAGNHGLAVAWTAARLGVAATIVVPAGAPPIKKEGIAAHGARLVEVEGGYDAAEAHAEALARRERLTPVHGFADERVIAGQGTIGWEIAADLPEVDTVLVPVGGGGLAAGVAAALAGLLPGTRVRGVQSELTPAMARSLAAGRVVPVDEPRTLCDGLAGGIHEVTLDYARRFLEAVDLVPEAAVARAMAEFARHERWIVEGSAAVVVARILTGPPLPGQGPLVLVLTGRNVDARRLRDVLAPDGASSSGHDR